MLTKIFAIATNTFLETIRQPIYGIILSLTCMMMVLNVSLAAYTLSDDNLFLRDLGLSTMLISGLFLASFSAAGVLNREIENKTVLTILSKPVSRPVLIAGKFIGLISALTTACYIAAVTMLLVIRHKVLQNTTDPWDWPVIIFGLTPVLITIVVSGVGNYLHGWQFSSTVVFLLTPLLTVGFGLVTIIDPKWNLQIPHLGEANLLGGILLILMMVWIIAAAAMAVSCRLGQVATLTICVVLLMVGLTSDYFLGQNQIADAGFFGQPSVSAMLAWVAYRVVPNLGIFWVADALAMGKNIAGQDIGIGYIMSALGYALLYIVAILMIGVAVFQKREVG